MEKVYRTLYDAYIEFIYDLAWKPNKPIVISEDNELTWEKLCYKHTITHPNESIEKLIGACPYGPKFMDQYADEVMNGIKSNFDYTYNERLFHYDILKNLSNDGVTLTRHFEVDQIQSSINKLIKNSNTRRAVCSTRYPYDDDVLLKSMPCLQNIQFLVRNGKLNMICFWRSRDMLMGMCGNVYALSKLHNYVANELDVEVGAYVEFIGSAHIYFKKDGNYLKDILKMKKV